MRAQFRRWVLACAAVAALFAAGYAHVAVAGPRDDEPPPATTPAPDPAPPVPKPAPKPAPKPVHVYHAPARVTHVTPTPTPQPTYTPPAPVVHTAKPKVVHQRKHKKRHHVAAPKPKPKPSGQVKHAAVVRVGGIPAAATVTSTQDNTMRALVVMGIGLAALLFLIVVAVPATAVRFTPAGRVVMDHQSDLVLGGVALLLLTALLYVATGSAS